MALYIDIKSDEKYYLMLDENKQVIAKINKEKNELKKVLATFKEWKVLEEE